MIDKKIEVIDFEGEYSPYEFKKLFARLKGQPWSKDDEAIYKKYSAEFVTVFNLDK